MLRIIYTINIGLSSVETVLWENSCFTQLFFLTEVYKVIRSIILDFSISLCLGICSMNKNYYYFAKAMSYGDTALISNKVLLLLFPVVVMGQTEWLNCNLLQEQSTKCRKLPFSL